MKRILVSIILALLITTDTIGQLKKKKPKADANADIREIVNLCSKEKDCSTIVRDIQVMEGSAWVTEPVLILRSKGVAEMKIARFNGKDGTYLVIMIPELSVDMGLVRIFEGK